MVLNGCFFRGSRPEPSYSGAPAAGTSARHADVSTNPAAGSDRAAAPQPATNAPIVTLAQGLNGRVSSANSNLKFAVITFPVGQMAEQSQRLHVYRGGMKVGELLVTGPQREDSTVADITAGEVQVGDSVRDR